MRLGKWGAAFNEKETHQFIESCLEMGLTTFDHADIYGDYTTEADFGKALKNRSSLRDKMQIITKCGIRRVCENRPKHRIKSYDSSSGLILESVNHSLTALQTDYIDVLLLHRPDYLMQPADVAWAFEKLHASGKVRAFGVSNFTPSQFDLLHSTVPLITNQVEISLLHRNAFDDGTLYQCLKLGIQPMAWSPLGGGRLFSSEETPQIQRIKAVARPMQEKFNATLDQLLFAWLWRHPSAIIPVTGTTKVERLKAALDAGRITLTREEWYDLWQAASGETIP